MHDNRNFQGSKVDVDCEVAGKVQNGRSSCERQLVSQLEGISYVLRIPIYCLNSLGPNSMARCIRSQYFLHS
jgi:hypothetical protein